MSAARSGKLVQNPSAARQTNVTHTRSAHGERLDDLVVMARGPTPDPIPNSAVKTLSADGTASQGAEE